MRNQGKKKPKKQTQERGFFACRFLGGSVVISVSPVTGVTFMWACNDTDVFAMGKSLVQSPALILEVCQHRITEWFGLERTLKII